MCSFLEKRLRARQTDRETERDETVFNGPNCPVGVGPKMTQIWPKRAMFDISQQMRKRHFFTPPPVSFWPKWPIR